jgi:transcription elongation factor GreA
LFDEETVLLTQAGYARLEKELERLRTVERRDVAERMRNSQQSGEFAENTEYEDAKAEQALVESRIRDLRRLLQRAEVIRPEDIPTDYVGMGSVVVLHDLSSGEDWTVTVVVSVEADPVNGLISNESPLGRALMGRKPGEKVSVQVPAGRLRYRIESISR